ncbi:MAG: HEAT repeat domain-containing protein, partial [Candidatus Omnitrophota bacterium]
FEKKIAYWGVSFPFEYRADEDASEDPFTRIMLEELKNAYDAQASFYDSIWRASSGIRKPENYTPEITVFFELIRRDENPVLKITVRDNGAGKKAADTARKRNEALEKMFSKYMGKAGGGDAWAIDLITRLWDLAGGIRPQKIFSRTFPEYGTDTVMYLPAKYAQFNKSGSETGMFISDTGQIAALRNVYEIIERDRINKPLSEDPAVTPAGDGSECSVYVVSGYKHVVFKIAHEYLDEYRFKFQTDNIAKIIRAKGSRRIRKDMFDLVSTPHIAPFAYLSFRSEAGKRVNMTVQQKAAMPATASDCENLEAGLRESGIDWADIMPNNAGMLETEYSGRNTPVPAVLDLGDLYLEDAVPPMIEMLFNSPHPDDRFHAACVLGTRGDPRALEPMKEALAKEQDESVREALSIYLGFFSANQDGGEGETLSAGEPDLSNIFPVAVDREMYLEDLYSAYMRGEIMEFPGAVDKFSPLRVGLMRDNSRGLAEGFIDYLKEAFLRGRDSGVPIRILVLGHGSGRECAQIYELAREYGCRVIIDAIGLTAIPPSIYLKIDAPELMRLAGQYTRDTDRAPAGWQQYIEDENDPVISSTRKSGVVSLITAFDLSNHFGIFDVFPQPFINKQYIGTLNSIETEGVYDIIYDNNGAARYEFLENGVAVTMSTIKRMLDPQGAFYMEDLPNRREYFAQLSSDPDLNVAAAGILNQTIVSFNDSLLQREAERGLVPRLQLDGGTMNDKVAGIDLRGLPAFSGQDGVHGILPSDAHLSLANRIMARLGKAESASQPADLDKEWSKIEQTVNSGAIPDTASLEGYVRACCQSGRIAAERDKVLLCIAGILRMEEDLSVSTEPQLKELLVLLDSPALS